MILDKLFKQYKKGPPKPCFGSKFANRVGNLLIGTPQQLGLDTVMPELQDTFYRRPADRFIPVDGDKLQKWKDGQKFVTEVRACGEPVVAKAGALAAIVLCLGLVGTAATWTQVTCGMAVKQARAQGPGGIDEDTINTVQQCMARGYKIDEEN